MERPKRHINKDVFRRIIKELALQNSSVTREFGSSALNYAWLASGKIDCLFTTNLNKNQIACGELLIKEAGGYISNLCAGPKLSLAALHNLDVFGYDFGHGVQ